MSENYKTPEGIRIQVSYPVMRGGVTVTASKGKHSVEVHTANGRDATVSEAVEKLKERLQADKGR